MSESYVTATMKYITPYPLDEFYSLLNLPMPSVRRVHPSEIPSIQRQLLVHDEDMTIAQENHYKQSLRVSALRVVRENDSMLRLVNLILDDDNPILFGAIHIHLDMFDKDPREQIEGCERPFGRILNDYAILHYSKPDLFFEILSDATINEALRLNGHQCLYGRVNTLYTPNNQPLAEVVEVLPSNIPERK
ncbi:MAG: hypothetical protein ACRBF0_14350 [Calditrichia bacterium]